MPTKGILKVTLTAQELDDQSPKSVIQQMRSSGL
jgi:predicted component of type VI protein secretion system